MSSAYAKESAKNRFLLDIAVLIVHFCHSFPAILCAIVLMQQSKMPYTRPFMRIKSRLHHQAHDPHAISARPPCNSTLDAPRARRACRRAAGCCGAHGIKSRAVCLTIGLYPHPLALKRTRSTYRTIHKRMPSGMRIIIGSHSHFQFCESFPAFFMDTALSIA